jgi:xylose isomerase
MNGKGLSVATVPFYPCGDRYVTGGYREDPYSFEEKLELIGSIEDVEGVELSFPAEFEDPLPVKNKFKALNLKVSNIEVELFGSPKWKYGALSSSDDRIRSEAIELSCRCMDAASELECGQISLWPGQDGYDYPLQVDYAESWSRTIDAIQQIASHRSDVRVAVEYKCKEPRTHIFLGTVGKTLLAIREVNANNIGVMIDFGHSMMAYESPAESAILAQQYGKLYHLHLNDNFRSWDDDMIVGSVHLWETLELFYILHRIGYDGWYSLDVFPYREENIPSIQSSLTMVKKMIKASRAADQDTLAALQKNNDAVGIQDYLRDLMLKTF